MSQKPKGKKLKVPDKLELPDILKFKLRPETAKLKELQEVADAFQPLVKEDTFAFYLTHAEGDTTPDSVKESISIEPEVGLTVDIYIERLLTAEKALYVYCGQRNIASRIHSGQYLIDVIRTFGQKKAILGDFVLSPNVEQYFKRTLLLLEDERNNSSVDKEQAFVILYNLLLVAQNGVVSKDQSSKIAFSCTDIYLPTIFATIESRMSPKVPFQKQCELAMQHFREKPQDQSKELRKAVEQFFAFGYFKMASEFVVERVKRLGML